MVETILVDDFRETATTVLGRTDSSTLFDVIDHGDKPFL